MVMGGWWVLAAPASPSAHALGHKQTFVVMGGWWVLAAPASHLLMRWVTSKPQAHLLCAKAE
ncbi:hypothetical protein O5169_03785 [Escherichia coli]|nr:hypothetical protein [Escherichia coli]